MGVHDYTCYFHSAEGEQCLRIHENCADYYDDDLSDCDDNCNSSHGDYIFGDDNNLKNNITTVKINKNAEILLDEDATTCEESSCGAGIAYLIVFNIPNSENITDVNTVEKLVRAGKYASRTMQKVTYEWDDWDFAEVSGYRNVLTDNNYDGENPYSIWQLSNKPNHWAFNMCPSCHDRIYDKNVADEICSAYIWEIVNKHNINIVDCDKNKQKIMHKIREYFKIAFFDGFICGDSTTILQENTQKSAQVINQESPQCSILVLYTGGEDYADIAAAHYDIDEIFKKGPDAVTLEFVQSFEIAKFSTVEDRDAAMNLVNNVISHISDYDRSKHCNVHFRFT